MNIIEAAQWIGGGKSRFATRLKKDWRGNCIGLPPGRPRKRLSLVDYIAGQASKDGIIGHYYNRTEFSCEDLTATDFIKCDRFGNPLAAEVNAAADAAEKVGAK